MRRLVARPMHKKARRPPARLVAPLRPVKATTQEPSTAASCLPPAQPSWLSQNLRHPLLPHPPALPIMSLVVPDQSQQFAHILRLLNTNVDGKRKIMYALTEIKGVGRRFANVVCKKADVDLSKRAGELNSDELERIVTIFQNPQEFKIPNWMLNRQRGKCPC